MFGPGHGQCGHRLLRRHGRVRHDRSIDDQCEIRRADTHCRGCGVAVFTELYFVRLQRNRADPDCRAGRRDVHGGDRHIRLEFHHHFIESPRRRRVGDYCRHRCHRVG